MIKLSLLHFDKNNDDEYNYDGERESNDDNNDDEYNYEKILIFE
jgi:hypothetical protein